LNGVERTKARIQPSRARDAYRQTVEAVYATVRPTLHRMIQAEAAAAEVAGEDADVGRQVPARLHPDRATPSAEMNKRAPRCCRTPPSAYAARHASTV